MFPWSNPPIRIRFMFFWDIFQGIYWKICGKCCFCFNLVHRIRESSNLQVKALASPLIKEFISLNAFNKAGLVRKGWEMGDVKAVKAPKIGGHRKPYISNTYHISPLGRDNYKPSDAIGHRFFGSLLRSLWNGGDIGPIPRDPHGWCRRPQAFIPSSLTTVLASPGNAVTTTRLRRWKLRWFAGSLDLKLRLWCMS